MEPTERSGQNVWGGRPQAPASPPQRWESPTTRPGRSISRPVDSSPPIVARNPVALGPVIAAGIGLLILLVSLVMWDRPTDYRKGTVASPQVVALDRSIP